jgi:hypothetical protein
MELTFTEGLFVCFVLGICMLAGYGIVVLACLLLDRLKGKRPYDGRFRVGVIL